MSGLIGGSRSRLGCLVVIAVSTVVAADDGPGDRGPVSASVRLGAIPKLKLRHRTGVSAEEARRIRQLIRRLAEIDSPDFGLSGTMSGGTFLPIDGTSQPGAFLFTDHRLRSSPWLRKLVELGPKLLPFLLDALDDRTPTKLVIKHDGRFGVMAFASGLLGNPVNRSEQKVLRAERPPLRLDGEPLKTYTVKVGDVCLVAIGQIVGRTYQAVWYQPTACIMLNSPTHDAELCRQVRDIWSSGDAARKLFDSLLLDYATQGISDGESLDGWGIGAHLQVEAAMRLLYYFPTESAEMIARRLDTLAVKAHGPGAGSMHTAEELDGYMKQCVANGVRADDFVKAVAWCAEPRIKAALLRVFDRATDPDVVVASMRSVGPDDPAKTRERAARMLAALPGDEDGPFGDGYHLLVALGKYGDAGAKSIFRTYLETRTVQRCRSTCHALRAARGEWAAELLAPLLDDSREADGWDYAVNPAQNEPRLPIRICDEAAETIAGGNKDLPFELRGTHADLDHQIEVMQRALKRMPHR
jgi:hypothetical protein